MEIEDINLKQLIESETGQHFNREGYICCPFHNEKTPSLSVKFFPDANKERFKCWGCKAQGDAIDFISQLKGLDYNASREYLGLSVNKSNTESLEDKIKEYIDWQLQNVKVGYKLLGLFCFVDRNNNPIYWKAKFKKPDGKKETPYYHIDEKGTVINNRGYDEVPYNLYNTLQGINDNKVIVFVEGEKDVNMINSLFKNKGFVATSIKGCKDLSILKQSNYRIYVIGDTGEAGEKYKYHIKKEFFEDCTEFRFVNLPVLKALGDNKDVTDWLEAGKTKKDLLNAFERSLNLKDRFELQQDNKGIYKPIIKDGEEGPVERRIYYTNFKILEASRIKYIEKDIEGIRLKLLSSTGEIIERFGPATVFDDLKAFRKFLNSMELTFMGKSEKLVDLKVWVNKYWALEVDKLYNGNEFLKQDDKLLFVTDKGALDCNGNIDTSIKSEASLIDLEGLTDITTEELREVTEHLFRFTNAEKSICIIGTIFNNMLVIQNFLTDGKLHHLLFVGESGAGKSTILENVILPILNYPKKSVYSIGMTKEFPLLDDLSKGNYVTIYEEYKPSNMGMSQNSMVSDVIRNLYTRTNVSKGQKDLTTLTFPLRRPLILVGEESYPNNEKAAIERSCIIYLAAKDRTDKSHNSLMWLIDHKELLNKLGYSMIKQALKLSVEEYEELFKTQHNKFKDKLKDRPLVTAANIATGIELFNRLSASHRLAPVVNYEDFIYNNIKEEVLNNGEKVNSVVENMIIEFNQMIEDGRALEPNKVVFNEPGGLFIRTNEMINQIINFAKTVGSCEFNPLKLKDFRKQATKAGYILKHNAKQRRVDGRTVWLDEYSKEEMRNLEVNSIIEPEVQKLTEEEQKVINGVF